MKPAALVLAMAACVGCYRSHEREDGGIPRLDAAACGAGAPEEWSALTLLANEVSGVAMSADPSCGVHVVLSQGPDRVVTHLRIDGDGAVTPQLIGFSGIVSADGVAVDGAGVVYAAYLRDGLRLAHRSGGGAWGEVLVDERGGFAAIAVTRDRDLVHALYPFLDDSEQLRHRSIEDRGTTLGPAETLDFRFSSQASVEIAPDGDVHATWSWVTSPSVHSVVYAHRDGDWTPTDLEPLDPEGELGSSSAVAIGPDGDVQVFYQAYAIVGGQRLQRARRSGAGASFTFTTIDDEVDGLALTANAAAVGPDGTSHVVYRGTGPLARYASGTTSFATETIEIAPDGASPVSVAVTPSGDVHVLLFDEGQLLHTRRRSR